MSLNLSIKLIKSPPLVASIFRNIRYGTAVGLTQTAKQAQAAVIESLKSTFTLRTRWYEPGNRFGIKIQPATRDRLQAAVQTRADWLEIHETGGTRRPKRKALAIPTDNVRRNKRQLIPRSQRPRNLARSFVIETQSGPVLFVRTGKGKRSKIRALYSLEPQAKIKRQSTFYEPISEVVKKNLQANITREVLKALLNLK